MSLRQQQNQSIKISLSIPLEHALFDVAFAIYSLGGR